MNRGDENGSSAGAVAPTLAISTPFGIGVRDPAWFAHRLVLLSSITAPSLLAQHDQDFHWALFADPDLPEDVQRALAKILAPFEGRATVHPGSDYKSDRFLGLAQERGLADGEGNVFTARIDDDDAWSRQTVGTARDRAAAWLRDHAAAPGLGFTFERGLEWIMYEMVDVDVLQKHGHEVRREATARSYSIPFLGTSVFVLSRASGQLSAISAGHSNMPGLLRKRGYQVDVIQTERPMWMYCRHKQAGSALQKARGEGMEVSLAELALEFGVDEALTARYLESADMYGYSVVKRIKRYRGEREGELREVSRRLEDPSTSEAQRSRLKDDEARLREEILEMSEDVVGDLAAALPAPAKDDDLAVP
jgi:hypothetical protein